MSADQAKLAHQLILVTNAFLYPVDKREEKTHAHYPIGKAVGEAVRGWLTVRSWTYFEMSTLKLVHWSAIGGRSLSIV